MVRNYEKRKDRVLNPENHENNCHKNLTEEQIELLNLWNNQLQLDNKSDTTIVDYLEKSSRFLRSCNSEEVQEIGKEEVTAYLSGKSQNSLRTYKATLRQFFLWFYLDHLEVEEGDIPRFVDSKLKVSGTTAKNKVKKEDIPTEEEVQTLMKHAANHRDRALIALLADKGMRIKEALELEMQDVNFDQAGIYLMVPEAKKDYESYRKNRLTWSRPALKDWIEHHPRGDEDNPPLFVKMQTRVDEEPFRAMTYDAARQMLNKLMKRADLPEHRQDRLSLHKFRHYSTTVDRQKQHMRDSFIVKDKGWDDPSMLEKYDHLTDQEVDIAHIKQMVEDGQLDKSVLEDFGNGEEDDLKEIELIRCPNCSHPNSPERDFCDQCNQPFNDEGIEKQDQLREAIDEYIEEKGLMEKLEQ